MTFTHLILKPFRIPSAMQLAIAELDEAQRRLLAAQTAQDYARRMVDYHTDRIARLTRYIKTADRLEKAGQE